MKKTVGLLWAMIAIFTLFGCSGEKYTKDGVTLTLSGDFAETELYNVQSVHVAYSSGDVIVAVFKDGGHEDSTMTVEEYAGQWSMRHVYESGGIEKNGNRAVLEHGINYGEGDHTSYTAFYKEGDTFWIIQFFCPDEVYAKYRSSFKSWAKKVEFN